MPSLLISPKDSIAQTDEPAVIKVPSTNPDAPLMKATFPSVSLEFVAPAATSGIPSLVKSSIPITENTAPLRSLSQIGSPFRPSRQ